MWGASTNIHDVSGLAEYLRRFDAWLLITGIVKAPGLQSWGLLLENNNDDFVAESPPQHSEECIPAGSSG